MRRGAILRFGPMIEQSIQTRRALRRSWSNVLMFGDRTGRGRLVRLHMAQVRLRMGFGRRTGRLRCTGSPLPLQTLIPLPSFNLSDFSRDIVVTPLAVPYLLHSQLPIARV